MNLSAWKDRLAAGKYDAPLAALYGAADAPRSRYARLCEEYLRTFGDAPDALLISAPGARSLPEPHRPPARASCSAPRSRWTPPLPPRARRTTPWRSSPTASAGCAYRSMISRRAKMRPARPPRSSAASRPGFAAGGLRIGGWRACIHSLVPAGGGLSSSAAFEILTGAIFSALYNEGRVDPLTLARIGQSAERNYFGKPSGLMDQAAEPRRRHHEDRFCRRRPSGCYTHCV